MIKTILICTVGGSHQPVLKALDATHPDFVCFICTGHDPETGKPGSEVQISGKGNIISAERGDPPSLPNIPILAGLSPDNIEICLVPADDLDQAFQAIQTAILDLIRRFSDVRLIADYTGGTKTMTAALVTAVLEIGGVDLQLVTGARADLNKVVDETEYAVTPNIDNIRLKRTMQPYLDAWKRYAYDEAMGGLAKIPVPSNAELRARLNFARNLSSGFAAWDRFDHRTALASLVPYRARIGQSLGLHLTALEILNEDGGNRREALLLYDLWLNAQRRAAQGRYDDAVARVYRLIEWTAQWQLAIHTGIKTSNIAEEDIPAGIELSRNREGKYQAGLFQAWSLLSNLTHSVAADFFKDHEKTLLNFLQQRNYSILAHGKTPVEKDNWKVQQDWLQDAFLPMLTDLIHKDAAIRFDLDRLKLPTTLPDT